MNDAQYQNFKDEMKEYTASVIRITVNGKIDNIDKKLSDYIKTDTAWKVEAQPVINMGKNINGFGKISKVILSLMVAIGSAWGLIEWISGKIANK